MEPETTFAQALTEAAAVVNSSLDFEQVLDHILEQVTRVVPGDTYNVILLDDGVGRIVRWRGYERMAIPDHEIAGRAIPVLEYETFCSMIHTGQPIVVDDTALSESWVRDPERRDHRAYLGAPIRIGARIEGFLNVNHAHPNVFTAMDARRLSAFADHAAMALQNARLYEEVKRHARELEARVEARTRELEARTAWSEAILRSTSDGFIVTDAAGTIVQTNPVAARWLEQVLDAESAEQLRTLIAQAARRAEEYPKQLVEFPGMDLELRASPIATTDGDNTAVVVAVHDVGHLRALDRMKSQFISDVSHELRTPIAAIRLYSSLIQKSDTDRQAAYFASLDLEIERVSRLVEGILQIARIEAGHIELTPRPLDLNMLVASVADSYAPTAEAKGLDLLCAVANEIIPVHADPHWLSQAIGNLVDNAIKHTPEGHVRVTTGIAPAGDPARDDVWATLTIEDTGIGIPPQERAHLFERFYRGEEARVHQVPGSGLGLAIAKGIVDLHGGRIAFAPNPVGGAQFTIALPLAPLPD